MGNASTIHMTDRLMDAGSQAPADLPPGSDEQDVRRRLLDAASEEFAARGFEAATVRDIVARARTNLNSINYHFGGKQALYAEVLRHQVALSEARHPQRSDERAEGAPEAALRAAVSCHAHPTSSAMEIALSPVRNTDSAAPAVALLKSVLAEPSSLKARK